MIMKLLESIFQDVWYSLRGMRRSPVLTGAAILSLGLGIGANTAIFSLIDAIVLRNLPVKSPQELVQLGWSHKEWPKRFVDSTSGRGVDINGQNVRLPFSYDIFQKIRARSTTLSGVVGRSRVYQPAIVVAQGRADTAQAELVSGNFFDVLGIAPAAGRTLSDGDDHEGAEPSAVLSYAYWTRRFAADPGIVGKSILINGVGYNIAGVAAAGFSGLEVGNRSDIFLALHDQPLVIKMMRTTPDVRREAAIWWVEIVGRRKPGVSEAQVRTELDMLFRQSLTLRGSAPVKPEDYPPLVLVSAAQGQSGLRSRFSQPLMVLMTIVGFVLLIGCANVANLLMARAVARRKEMALRHALGATSGRLFRQMIAESIVLALAGGGVGLAIAHWGTIGLLRTFFGEANSLDGEMNGAVLGFLIAVSLLVGVVFGLAPAIQSARVDLNTMLKGSSSDSARRFGMGRILVTLQVAVSLTLLIGAGLYVRTLWNLRHVALGFNPDNVLVFHIAPKRGGYEGEHVQQLIDRVLEKVRALPGVRSASYSEVGLLAGTVSNSSIRILGRNDLPKSSVYFLSVGDNFFSSMQMPIAGGRPIDPRDRKGAPMVAVVNEQFAKTYFNSATPLGGQFTYAFDDYKIPIEIIGVVKDAKYEGVAEETHDVAYLAYAQRVDDRQEATFAVRTANDPAALGTAVRGVMQSIDPNLPLFGVTTQTAQFDASIRDQRLMAGLAGGFGALALVLAAIGMYGVIAYSVTRRTAEIGIRMALGAGRSRVLMQVLRESMLPVGVGTIAGLGIAWGATKFIASQLYGLEPRDPATMIAAAALIVIVAMAATLLPARRASKVDPMTALRHE
jgi:macrolide transport system ATP-binding/permease protein